MAKSLLYRFFGLGGIPRKVRPALAAEQIVLAEEGIAGRLICRNLKGPGRRYFHRSKGFPGSLVITKKRLLVFVLGRRRINVALDEPRLADIYVDLPDQDTLALSFESSVFMDGWEGQMEYRFKTEKAMQFQAYLCSSGATQGVVPPRPEEP